MGYWFLEVWGNCIVVFPLSPKPDNQLGQAAGVSAEIVGGDRRRVLWSLAQRRPRPLYNEDGVEAYERDERVDNRGRNVVVAFLDIGPESVNSASEGWSSPPDVAEP